MLLTRGLGDGNYASIEWQHNAATRKLVFFQLSCQHLEVEASRELVLSGNCTISTHQGWGPPERNLSLSRISPIGVL